LAVKNGHVDIASILLQHGSMFNEADTSGNTPLHYAAAYGFWECVDLLVTVGADLNINNTWNLAPISVAMAKGHFGIVRRLLDYPGTDINCKDVDGRTLISKALDDLSPRTLEHIKYLVVDKKADPNISDTSGYTPLHYLAAYNVNTYVQKQLRYVSQELKNRQYNNLSKKFSQEAQNLVREAIEILLEHGADPNAKTINDLTVWQLTLNNSNISTLKFLQS
jgi:ankyrin repeat protein